MPISVTEPIGKAFERTKMVLFKPFKVNQLMEEIRKVKAEH